MKRLQFVRLNKGFTLVELILSVAILALVSVTMLPVFISASDFNKRAEDLDQSIQVAMQVMETIKSDQINQLNDIGYQGKQEGDRIVYQAGFDINWKVVAYDSNEALFYLSTSIQPVGEVQGSRQLYALEVDIQRLKPYFKGKELKPILYTLATESYIAKIGEVTP